MLFAILSINVSAVTQINIFNFTVTEPVAGEKPIYEASLPETASTYVKNVMWEGDFDENGCFKQNRKYTVYITAWVKQGMDKIIVYVDGKAKINGKKAQLLRVSPNKKEIEVYYEFVAGSVAPSKVTGNSKSHAATYKREDLSLHDYEWEVLRLTNIVRAKGNLDSLSMTNSLQLSCDIREEELHILFDHQRPDGTYFDTAMFEDMMVGMWGENIARGQPDPSVVMNDWVNSPGHYENIMRKAFGYLGVGYNPSTKGWVQIFSSRDDVTSYTVSTDQRVFEKKEDILGHYMTLVTKRGIVSFLPLDFDSMKEKDGTYTPRVNGKNMPVFAIGDPASFDIQQPDTSSNIPTATETPSADIKEHLEKNKSAILKAIDDMKIESDFNQSVMDAVILNATFERAGSSSRPSIDSYDYSYTPATSDKDGVLKAVVELYDSGVDIKFEINRVIPAFGGTMQTPGRFADVKSDAYYNAAVNWAVGKNITAGTSDTTFSPDNTCTRAQIITFLWRAVGSPKIALANPFNDVSQSDYFYDAALWAYDKGMVLGRTFDGNTPCTRSATVTYLWKNASSPSASYGGNFLDVSIGSDYAQAVAWAVDKKITSGTSDTTFSPDATCTRGQIVTFLMRALG